MTPMIIDDIDLHIEEAGSIDRAALVPGMYLAWCVNLQLVAPKLEGSNGRDMLRLRYRELSPAAFFTKVAHGRLTDDLLSEQGSAFAALHYAQYRTDNAASLYDAKDDWNTYDSIAPALTKAYYAFAEGGRKSTRPAKHWWQGWRS
jgi:hypothetical protein